MRHRLLNIVRCQWSYCLSLFGIERVKHMPTFVAIEPANYCMLRCPECPVGMAGDRREKRQLMTLGLAKRVVDEVADYAHTTIFYFQGEPTLNPELEAMIAYAKEKGLYTLLSTNAQLIDKDRAKLLVDSGVDRIIVSMDGLSQEAYEQYRVGGRVEKAKDALAFLYEAKEGKKRPILVLQCLRLKSNEHEWEQIKKLYKTLGADRLEMKTAQLYDYAQGNALMPTDTRFARYKQGKDGKWHLKKRLRNHCYRLWSGCVITAEGEVLPCCFDKAGAYSYGNLQEQTLRTIWHSQKAEQFRQRVLRERKAVDICTNCTE